MIHTQNEEVQTTGTKYTLEMRTDQCFSTNNFAKTKIFESPTELPWFWYYCVSATFNFSHPVKQIVYDMRISVCLKTVMIPSIVATCRTRASALSLLLEERRRSDVATSAHSPWLLFIAHLATLLEFIRSAQRLGIFRLPHSLRLLCPSNGQRPVCSG